MGRSEDLGDVHAELRGRRRLPAPGRHLGFYDKVLQAAPPTDAYNCHGWTFTGGEKWINFPDDVERILEDNGYARVPGGGVQTGDLVIYRKSGEIKHSGIVTAVDGGGNPTQIESKWGAGGRYLHAPGDVPPGYGQPEYWRTSRPNGHLLAKMLLSQAEAWLWWLWFLMQLLQWIIWIV